MALEVNQACVITVWNRTQLTSRRTNTLATLLLFCSCIKKKLPFGTVAFLGNTSASSTIHFPMFLFRRHSAPPTWWSRGQGRAGAPHTSPPTFQSPAKKKRKKRLLSCQSPPPAPLCSPGRRRRRRRSSLNISILPSKGGRPPLLYPPLSLISSAVILFRSSPPSPDPLIWNRRGPQRGADEHFWNIRELLLQAKMLIYILHSL